MSVPSTVYKAHATGNDFVVYADPDGVYEPTAQEVRLLCDRHVGIGADGLIRLAHPGAVSDLDAAARGACEAGGAAWFMDYRNADGSLAEMCGNGTRAITLFAQHEGLADPAGGAPFRLGTRAGVKTLTPLGDAAPFGRNVFRVDMGAWSRGRIDGYEVTFPGGSGMARGTFVDMGNPHVVAVLEDGASTLPCVEALDLTVKPVVSPRIDTDQNVEFVRVDGIDDGLDETRDGRSVESGRIGRATMRVHERGCGETLSCGTGLCATGVTLRARTGVDHWLIDVRGGTVRVDVTDEHVTLTGSATLVARIDLLD